MGIFTRKRPPVYKWDNEWDLVDMIFDDIPVGDEWEWTCDSDHYYEMISQTWSLTLFPIVGNHIIYSSLSNNEFRLMTWGHRTWFQAGTCINSNVIIAQRYLYALVGDRSFNNLPHNLFVKPGQRLKVHLPNGAPNTQLDYVTLYMKRWSIR